MNGGGCVDELVGCLSLFGGLLSEKKKVMLPQASHHPKREFIFSCFLFNYELNELEWKKNGASP